MKPTRLSENLKQLLANKGLTTASLARLTGIGQPVIYRLLSGETDNPKLATLIPIAEHFGLSISQLIGAETLPSSENAGPVTTLPLLSWEQAIHWKEIIANDLIPRTIPMLEHISPQAYALNVKDTTMSPKFPESTVLIIDPELTPKNNDFVVAHFANQNKATFKQLLFDGDERYLKPLNPDFSVTHIKENQPCNILGVLVEARLKF